MNEQEDFVRIASDVDESLRRAVRAFATWFAREWQITPEQWAKDMRDPVRDGKEWFDGYNSGVEGALIAVDCFLDENVP